MKIIFLTSQPKHMLWVLKHMFKLMDKKIIAILRMLFLLNWPYGFYVLLDNCGTSLLLFLIDQVDSLSILMGCFNPFRRSC